MRICRSVLGKDSIRCPRTKTFLLEQDLGDAHREVTGHQKAASLSMEVIELSPAFVQHPEDDLIFDHTKLIFRRQTDGQYFYARSPRHLCSASAVDLDELKLIEMPTDHLWPVFDSRFSRAPHPLAPNSYVKRPSLIDYGDSPASCRLANQILSEAEICEIIKEHPHPSLAEYLGCVVEDERITGLCFVKYEMTLAEHKKLGKPLDVGHCLQTIEDGIKHLHGLGLVHNDLNPRNIMMKDGAPVIIDFDSCTRKGMELGFKTGTHGWSAANLGHAVYDNDFYSISKIRDFLTGDRDI
ncbi:hypothetical protein VTK73DRAFT_1593 [Phialemonium thermophilum]|uniref:Protein kinase domain-containing protein n=1 Tax=Phialemonium thermophilum TaxID=223376 RepID=A0ABR3Y321_9PEZI